MKASTPATLISSHTESGYGERDTQCGKGEGLQRHTRVDDRVPAGLESTNVAWHPVGECRRGQRGVDGLADPVVDRDEDDEGERGERPCHGARPVPARGGD